MEPTLHTNTAMVLNVFGTVDTVRNVTKTSNEAVTENAKLDSLPFSARFASRLWTTPTTV